MFRYRAFLCLLLTVFIAGTSFSALAQEEAAMSSKEQRQHDRAERKRLKKLHRQGLSDEDKPPMPLKRKYAVEYPPTVLKTRYRIDILSQLYLDDLVKGGSITYKDRIPDKAVSGMSFYQGINIAADSLKRAGYKIDIYIHDIASAAETPSVLAAKGALDSADLIIGAVPSADVALLADLAAKKHINFISALSSSDGGVHNDPWFTMLVPTLRAHCEWQAGYVAARYARQKVLLLYRKSVEADSLAWKYTTASDTLNATDIQRLSCTIMPSRERLAGYIDSGKTNVVLIPIADNTHADSMIKMLSSWFPSSRFEVYGLPAWHGMSAARKKAMPNISIHTTTAFTFDKASASARYVSRMYKKDYGGAPSDMVFRGYESLFWYASLLKKYGTVFNEHYADNTQSPFTRFEVKPQWDKAGEILYHENVHIIPAR